MNYFMGLNIADSPLNIIQNGIKSGAVLLVIVALLIPILSGLTQWLSVKMMDSSNPNRNQPSDKNPGTMETSLKMMNNVMPIMSVIMCFTPPTGLGIYWVASAVVRIVQQYYIDRYLNRIDLDEMVQKNLEKANEKRKKQGLAAHENRTPAGGICQGRRAGGSFG